MTLTVADQQNQTPYSPIGKSADVGQIRFLNRDGQPIMQARTGEELYIALDFEGSRPERRSTRLSIDFYNLSNIMFVCASEASYQKLFQIGAGDTAVCRILRLPLSEGRYYIELFLEQNGIIEDWLVDRISIDVSDQSFFGTARNQPQGWEGRVVLVDHEWLDPVDKTLDVTAELVSDTP